MMTLKRNEERKIHMIFCAVNFEFYDFITFLINSLGKVPRVITTAAPSPRSGSAQQLGTFFEA